MIVQEFEVASICPGNQGKRSLNGQSIRKCMWKSSIFYLARAITEEMPVAKY